MPNPILIFSSDPFYVSLNSRWQVGPILITQSLSNMRSMSKGESVYFRMKLKPAAVRHNKDNAAKAGTMRNSCERKWKAKALSATGHKSLITK